MTPYPERDEEDDGVTNKELLAWVFVAGMVLVCIVAVVAQTIAHAHH